MKLINKEYQGFSLQEDLLSKFIIEAKMYGMGPSVIVDYRRLAFVYPVSDVRITFDENIKSGMYSFDLLDKKLDTFTVTHDDIVEVEIKCNEFIPEHILNILNSIPKSRMALSKYALCYSMK